MPTIVLTRREVEASVKTLQPLPRAVMRLVELVESETATVEQMEQVINTDPVLCGKVLQIANSAYYGLARSVSSIRHALILLGAHTIKGIALSVAAMSVLRSSRVISEAEQRLWKHSLACAGYAQEIARACRWGARLSEDAYIAGLLHDIGALFLLTRFPEQYQPLLRRESETALIEHETGLFGYDHAAIGAMILDHWRLPERLVKVVGNHHAPFLPEDETRQLVAAVMLADAWSEQRGEPPSIPEAVAELTRLSEETVSQIRARVEAGVDAHYHALVA